MVYLAILQRFHLYSTYKGCYFNDKPNGNYDICPVCFWEDDPIQLEDVEYEGGANRVSLVQARHNFLLFGACEEEMKKHVRQPKEDEINGIDW